MKNNLRNKVKIDNEQLTIRHHLSIRVCQLLVLVTIGLFVGCSKKETAQHDTYTCPMHLQIVQDKPGTCPVCGMELVLKGRASEEVKVTKELSNLAKPTSAAIVSSIKTIKPLRREMMTTSEAKGVIAYDTRRATTLPIRYGGRVEKLYIKYNFQPVHKGQMILEIYSPELVTAQRELLYLLESEAQNIALINGAKQRLFLLGVSEDQMRRLETLRKESYSFPVFSPADGYVVEQSALSNAGNDLPAEVSIREGMYVVAGQSLFKIVNTSIVWAEFDLYQKDAVQSKINDPVTITFDNTGNEVVNAKINFIQPFLKASENFIKLRVYLANPNGRYNIGELVTASIATNPQAGLWIPSSTILDLGTRKIVFVKRRGVFRPQSVETGRQSNKWIELISGADENDSLAYHAQFMVDSEGFIKVVR